MNKILLIIAFIINYQLSFSQYCVSGGPTSLADSNIGSVNLVGDVGSISFTGVCIGNQGVIGVQDETALMTELSGGSSYSLAVDFGTCGGSYAGAGEAWIDYNNNQQFEPNESLGSWTGIPPAALSNFAFTVPGTIVNGVVRMRVMQRESASIPLDPCASYSWGAVVDFSIILTGGVDCTPYVGNNTADPIIVSSLPYTNNHDNSICYTNDSPAYSSVDVFYLVLPPANSSSISVSLCGSSFDTFLSVFDTDGNTITFNDDGSCGAQSEVTFSTVGLDSAYVIVEGWGTEFGAYTIEIIESPLGVDDNSVVSHKMFPNPTQSHFKINNLKTNRIQIVDVAGSVIKSISNYSGQLINIEELKTGLYFVNYTLDGLEYTKKIIKK